MALDFLRSSGRTLAFFGILLTLLGCETARAERDSLSDLVRTSWTGRDGSPRAINSLAQTPDGMLWIGSTGGLFSFDGLAFHAFQAQPGDPALPSNAVRSLHVSRAGDLWVTGAYVGAVAKITRGRVSVFGKTDAETAYRIHSLQEDSKGGMWAVLNYRVLVHLGSDGTWHSAQTPNAARGYLQRIFMDSQDCLWAVEAGVVYRRPAGSASFTVTGIRATGDTVIAEGAHKDLWIWDEDLERRRALPAYSQLQHVNASGFVLGARKVRERVNAMLPLPDQSVWIVSNAKRSTRLSADQVDGFHADADAVLCLENLHDGVQEADDEEAILRDADGSIWLGGIGGLDQFKPATLIPAIAGPAGDWSACTNPQGEVWIASSKGALNVLRNHQVVRLDNSTSIEKLFCAGDGDVYILDNLGIGYVQQRRIRRLPLLPGYGAYGSNWNFITMARTANGSLLASVGSASKQFLWQFEHGRWAEALPHSPPWFTTAMLLDSTGRLFLGQFDGKVSVYQNGQVRKLAPAPFAIGVIQAFAETKYGVFALGANGVALQSEPRPKMLRLQRPEYALTVTGLVQAKDGSLWINGARGIVRIAAGEVLAGLNDSRHEMAADQISEGDFVGPAYFWNPTPSAMSDTTGQLWFSTFNGVVSLDPEKAKRPARLPRVSIHSVTADGRAIGLDGKFPPNVRSLEIRYFGIYLPAPQKVTYRYQLEGFDSDWQDVGQRTEAIYTGLRPGTYRFRVMASNGREQWTAPVVASPFVVLPSFYQTFWFRLACAIGALGLVWLFQTLRLKNLVREVRLKAEERADERITIARELHDTLLQGVQGLLLSFHVAYQTLPPEHHSKNILERALTQADQVIIEGRNRLVQLRSGHLPEGELSEALERVGLHLNEQEMVSFEVEQTGTPRKLRAHVPDEVFYIMREALTNAFRHSEATSISIWIRFERQVFTVLCRDNGRGFDPSSTTTQEQHHWGLPGMEERAQKIGGRLTISSKTGAGTDVILSVSGMRAYSSETWVQRAIDVVQGWVGFYPK